MHRLSWGCISWSCHHRTAVACKLPAVCKSFSLFLSIHFERFHCQESSLNLSFDVDSWSSWIDYAMLHALAQLIEPDCIRSSVHGNTLPDAWNELAELSCPTFIMHGKQHGLRACGVEEEIFCRFSGVELWQYYLTLPWERSCLPEHDRQILKRASLSTAATCLCGSSSMQSICWSLCSDSFVQSPGRLIIRFLAQTFLAVPSKHRQREWQPSIQWIVQLHLPKNVSMSLRRQCCPVMIRKQQTEKRFWNDQLAIILVRTLHWASALVRCKNETCNKKINSMSAPLSVFIWSRLTARHNYMFHSAVPVCFKGKQKTKLRSLWGSCDL